mgnify:CR=1 FL=1
MKTLRANKAIPLQGFNFHVSAGYPPPTAEELKKAWNAGVNGQIDNFRHRESVAKNYGTEVVMECIWLGGGAYKWRVKEIFFK